jgi:hypothetical protein
MTIEEGLLSDSDSSSLLLLSGGFELLELFKFEESISSGPGDGQLETNNTIKRIEKA